MTLCRGSTVLQGGEDVTRTLLTIFALIVLTSCASVTNVQKPLTPKHAPNNYVAVGVVQYSTSGFIGLVDNRRSAAFKEMKIQCEGDYTVIREGHVTSGTIYSKNAFTGNYEAGPASSNYQIHYVCAKKIRKPANTGTCLLCN